MPRNEKGLGRREVAPADPRDRVEGVRYYTPAPTPVEDGSLRVGDRVKRVDGKFSFQGTVRRVLKNNPAVGSVVVVEWDEDIDTEPDDIFGDLRTCTNDPEKLEKV